MYGLGRGNTVCHLNTDASLCCNSSGDTACGGGSEVLQSNSRANERGREGNGSGELAGDNSSKANEEHSGSGSKESDLLVGESEGSVEESLMVCGKCGAGNTVSWVGDQIGGSEEVARVEEMVDKDVPRAQNG